MITQRFLWWVPGAKCGGIETVAPLRAAATTNDVTTTNSIEYPSWFSPLKELYVPQDSLVVMGTDYREEEADF